ncbi:hypothetical protein ACNJ7E_14980 [Rhodococcus sp. NM-2]|uniref:hypothetical protein n=1 Tax=Rhodococcus sp. NM-2 TaxID=3401174 RepID=UPI003AAE67BC
MTPSMLFVTLKNAGVTKEAAEHYRDKGADGLPTAIADVLSQKDPNRATLDQYISEYDQI